MNSAPAATAVRTIGRYALYDEIAAGGMATVHLGRLLGPVGFSRTVAIKRLHSHFAKDPEFSAGFVDEARLAARIHHPNVVPIIDVLAADGELSLVMDYVEGDSLAKLLRQTVSDKAPIPLPILSAIICGSLYGLHAAHEAVDEKGRAMELVHRDISPQNILVGTDGVPRILDFGVAKAAQRLQTTAEGQVKGKVAYMAPEQIRQAAVSRTTDVYAMGVVLWETIAGRRLFQSDNPANLMIKVLEGPLEAPSAFRLDCPPELDAVVFSALNRDVSRRYPTARAFAQALQQCITPAPPTDVSDWINSLAVEGLTDRRRLRARVESQDFHEDSESAKEFFSRPRHEELATVADARAHSTLDDSTQAISGLTSRASTERNRIFFPLVLGMLAVAAGIALLLFLNSPELHPTNLGSVVQPIEPAPGQAESATMPHLDDDATQQTSPGASKLSGGPDSQPGSNSVAELPDDAVSNNVAPANVGDNAAPHSSAPNTAASSANSTAQNRGTQAASTTKSRAATSTEGPSDASCPKFTLDADGIRRINRKCWK